MKNIFAILVMTGLFFVSSALSQDHIPFGLRHGKLMDELKLTDIQKEQFDKMRFETQKKQIDLRAKIASARLDLEKMLTSDSPDKSSLEKKLNEIASFQTAMKMNHFNAWSENNKVLTPEQQKVWKKALMQVIHSAKDKMSGMMHRNFRDKEPRHEECPCQ
jgi:Spy/CpxP family protein refolding chaperone